MRISNVLSRHVIGINKNDREIGKITMTMKSKYSIVNSGYTTNRTVLAQGALKKAILLIPECANTLVAGSTD